MNQKKVPAGKKIIREVETILHVTIYFFIWLAILMIIKKLLLKDYNIEFKGLSIAIISSLIIAKVVLLMDLISLGSWVKKQGAYVDIILRTILYTLGVLAVSLLEKAIEARNEASGFTEALTTIFHHRDIYKIWTNTIVICLALFWFNVYRVLQLYLQKAEFSKIFFNIPLEELKANKSE